MTKTSKLIEAIRNNPKTVRFDEACKIAVKMGFSCSGGKGSHQVFKRLNEPVQLNFQNRNGYIPYYQAMQLNATLEKYEAEQ
jgi:hypothetical protein